MQNPRFISIAGVDGCGKDTQAPRLTQALRDRGHHTRNFRAPGTSTLGNAIRAVVLDPAHAGMDHKSSSTLFAVAWRDMVQGCVEPALQNGEYVVVNRGPICGRVYAGGFPPDLTDAERRERADYSELAYLRLSPMAPDLTILLDVAPSTAMERRAQRGDAANRFDPSDLETASRIRLGYLALARQRDDVLVVNGEPNADEVARRVLRCVDEGVGDPVPGTMKSAAWMVENAG